MWEQEVVGRGFVAAAISMYVCCEHLRINGHKHAADIRNMLQHRCDAVVHAFMMYDRIAAFRAEAAVIVAKHMQA